MPFDAAVRAVMEQKGVESCAIVDIETGECLARAGVAVTGFLETAGMVNAAMLRAKMHFAADQHHETIEDVLITLDRHYHMIRLVRCATGLASLFLYAILNKQEGNLALSRRKVAEVLREMVASDEMAKQIEKLRQRLTGGELEPKVFGNVDSFAQPEELPAFMRDDVAMKLLGINTEDNDDDAVTFPLHHLPEGEQ